MTDASRASQTVSDANRHTSSLHAPGTGDESTAPHRDLLWTVFELASREVPAYRQHLARHGIDPGAIGRDQLDRLPLTDKQTYLEAYDYLDLFPDRLLTRATTISATSGSTGVPFYFPRGEEQDLQYQQSATAVLGRQFRLHERRTLVVLCFALGIWIGGVFTYKVLNRLASEGYPICIAPIGLDMSTALQVIGRFDSAFDQVVVGERT